MRHDALLEKLKVERAETLTEIKTLSDRVQNMSKDYSASRHETLVLHGTLTKLREEISRWPDDANLRAQLIEATTYYKEAVERRDIVKRRFYRLQRELRDLHHKRQSLRESYDRRLAFLREDPTRNRLLEETLIAAGVPPQHCYNAKVVVDDKGQTHIYFGGVWSADGPGHGDYAFDSDGKTLYKHEPKEAGGPSKYKAAGLCLDPARRDHPPIKLTPDHDGIFYCRINSPGTSLRVRQHFADGYTVTWLTTSGGVFDVVWTNSAITADCPQKYLPPPDALFV